MSTAKQRIDNYAAGFLSGGKARAVLADGHHGPADYLKAIFTTNQTIEDRYGGTRPTPTATSPRSRAREVSGRQRSWIPIPPTSGFYRSLVGDRDLTTEEITGGFAVPGHAAPKGDGAPIYDEIPTVTDTASPVEPAAVLPPDTRLTLLEKVAGSGDTAVYRTVGLDDPSITGFVVARDIEPRDSIAPHLAELSGGSGKAYTTGATDGVHTLAGTLNETAAWSVTVKRGDATVAAKSGSGSTFSVGIDAAVAGDGAYSYRITGTDDWANAGTMTGTFSIDNVAPALTDVSPGSDTVKWVSPNGDLARNRRPGARRPTKPGPSASRSSMATVRPFDPPGSRRARAPRPSPGMAARARASRSRTVTTDPPHAAGRRRQRRQTIRRPVLVDTTLGDVDASKALFYPQDADRLRQTTTLRFVPDPTRHGHLDARRRTRRDGR